MPAPPPRTSAPWAAIELVADVAALGGVVAALAEEEVEGARAADVGVVARSALGPGPGSLPEAGELGDAEAGVDPGEVDPVVAVAHHRVDLDHLRARHGAARRLQTIDLDCAGGRADDVGMVGSLAAGDRQHLAGEADADPGLGQSGCPGE